MRLGNQQSYASVVGRMRRLVVVLFLLVILSLCNYGYYTFTPGQLEHEVLTSPKPVETGFVTQNGHVVPPLPKEAMWGWAQQQHKE